MNTDMYIYTYKNMYMCVYVCVFVFLLCGAVSCRVSRVVVGWVVGCGVVWCCRHVVVMVVFVLEWWSLSLRRHRKIERRKKSKKEMS